MLRIDFSEADGVASPGSFIGGMVKMKCILPIPIMMDLPGATMLGFNFRIITYILFATIFLGCAKVPPEAVVLSATIGKDLVAVQTAHNQLVRQYFASMRNNANAFVDDEYRPFIVRKTIEDLDLINELIAASKGTEQDGLDPLDLMEIYAEETISQIESFRSEMVTPIDKQEQQLLSELDQTYGVLLNANSTVTGHLRSVVKVHEAQSELLGDLGLPTDLRNRVTEGTSGLSQELNQLLLKAKASDEKFDALASDVEKLFSKN